MNLPDRDGGPKLSLSYISCKNSETYFDNLYDRATLSKAQRVYQLRVPVSQVFEVVDLIYDMEGQRSKRSFACDLAGSSCLRPRQWKRRFNFVVA